MNKPGVIAFASQFAPRLAQVRRGTWIAVGLGVVGLLGLALWVAVALVGWLFGQGTGWLGAAREMAAGPAQAALEQVDQAMPGVRHEMQARLGHLPPAQTEERPLRDVSGSDLAPVPRYPGLARAYWHRDGRQVTVEYEGPAEYESVLAHYRNGFIARGYDETLGTATPDGETHSYAKGGQHFLVTVSRDSRHGTGVHIETTLP